MSGNGTEPTAAQLLTEWRQFLSAREELRKRLPPVMAPQDKVDLFMMDLAQFAKFQTRTIQMLAKIEERLDKTKAAQDSE